jgi:hypothetical protein
MNTIYQQMALRLKIARQSAGYKTAVEAAHAFGIPQGAYFQHENGRRNINAEQLIDYGQKFGVSPHWLLTGEGHPCPKDKAERKAAIDKAVASFQNSGQLPASTYPPLAEQDASALVDMPLFREILTAALSEVMQQRLDIHSEALFSFCIDIYNNVAFSKEDKETRRKMIQLSIHSMLMGSKVIKKMLASEAVEL